MKNKISKNNKRNNRHPLEFLSRLEAYVKSDTISLDKHGIIKKSVIMFKKRKKIPFLSRIAIKIISKQGGIIDIQFSDALKIKK